MPKSKNAEAILSDKSWSVVEFNDVVDVWPRKQKWMPSMAPQPARHYCDILQLKKIVREAQKERDEVLAKIAALKDKLAVKREIPKQMTTEDWERMFE